MTGRDMFTLIFTGTWCLLGAIFLAVGYGLRTAARRREEGLRARAEGVVTEVVRRFVGGPRRRMTRFNPIVEYEAQGRRFSLEYTGGSGIKDSYEGQKVQVLYDPDDPARFMLEGKSDLKLAGTIMLWVGAASAVVGVLGGIAARSLF